MLNPSFNQSLVFICVAVITGAPFYFRFWVAKNTHQPAEIDRKVSHLTSVIFIALFLGAFLFSQNSRASGEVLLAAAIISFSILYRSRWAHLCGRTVKKQSLPTVKKSLLGKAFFLAAMALVALVSSRFPLAAPLFLLAFPFLAPYSLRLQHPCEKMADSELKRDFFQIFKNSGVKLHEVYLIDSSQTQFTNAMLAGRTLFLTVSLFEQLSEVELQAVVYHEAAHLKANHLWKRLGSGLTYLFLGIFWAVLPFCLWMPGNLAVASASILLAVSIQLFFLGRKIYQQELEADQMAVEMGASSDALISALSKLSPGSAEEMSAFTRLIFGVYHPTGATRIEHLRSERSKKHSLVFPKKQYLAAYSLFVIGFTFYSAQNIDTKLERKPAKISRSDASEKSR